MAIAIIGQQKTSDKLPRAEAELPPPSGAPAAQPLHTPADWARFAEIPVRVLQGAVIGHADRAPDRAPYLEALAKLAAEAPPEVAEPALGLLADAEYAPAADIAERRFKEGDDHLAAAAASLLGTLDAPRLLAALKARARLDDLAYAATVNALARSRDPAALEWLGKSMNRAGALGVRRRMALYSAALLSGVPELGGRVIGLAISDSRDTREDAEPSSARMAISALAGLPPGFTARETAKELYAALRRRVGERLPSALERGGFEPGRAAESLSALAPIAERQAAPDSTPAQRSVFERRRALLSQLVAQKEAIARLPEGGDAIFVAAAVASAELVEVASLSAANAPATQTLGKILELSPEALAALDAPSLTARLEAAGERKHRQVAGVIANEEAPTAFLERLVDALVAAGGAAAVFEAASTAKRTELIEATLKRLPRDLAATEAVVVEALERRPLEARATELALVLASRAGTERALRAIGRRYYELRAVARLALADASIQLGDPRLLPLVESRAYPGEPERIASAILRLMAGASPEEPKVAEILAELDVLGSPTQTGEVEGGIRLPLRCKVCDETLFYTMVRVYLDPKAQAKDMDPAFAGDARCKACGAEDELTPTEEASAIMVEAMMELMAATRAGQPSPNPLVTPATTRHLGREVGFAEALRRANAEVSAAPDSIRARLRRAMVRVGLWRKSALEDAEAALAIDPRSPEALFILGAARLQANAVEAAVEPLSHALERCRAEEEPRLYEEELEALTEEIEVTLLEIEERGVELPKSLDLELARERRDRRSQEELEALERYSRRLEEERS